MARNLLAVLVLGVAPVVQGGRVGRLVHQEVQKDTAASDRPGWTTEIVEPEGPTAVAQADSLNKDLFNGETAFKAFCSFWERRVHRHQYRAEGCTAGCATIDIDCNTGDDDGVINITYVRPKGYIRTKITVFGVHKQQRSNKDGRFLLFKNKNGVPVQEGCESWMQSPLSWCEGPKWSKKEDDAGVAKGIDLRQGSGWTLTYNWLRFSEQDAVWVLEEDVIDGEREADVPMVAGMNKQELLGPHIGTVGPEVDTTYTMGATGFTDACFENDKAMGTNIPVTEQTECKISVVKANPMAGMIVTSSWRTTHHPTEVKHRFSL